MRKTKEEANEMVGLLGVENEDKKRDRVLILRYNDEKDERERKENKGVGLGVEKKGKKGIGH